MYINDVYIYTILTPVFWCLGVIKGGPAGGTTWIRAIGRAAAVEIGSSGMTIFIFRVLQRCFFWMVK